MSSNNSITSKLKESFSNLLSFVTPSVISPSFITTSIITRVGHHIIATTTFYTGMWRLYSSL